MNINFLQGVHGVTHTTLSMISFNSVLPRLAEAANPRLSLRVRLIRPVQPSRLTVSGRSQYVTDLGEASQ